ncbi:membrane-associated phosphatidylinositol transfer protein 2 isoform X4 [Clupea harengus]|uniref:Membrane-associated phosphatidylinositol transfer protein 2 isoform X4 n=1 Tax=Clupea harengus TaxID=7950 RepID=A0A6P8GC18_CLUHA|nr:membrane-associated phosphatidylinositol transfer protein 2 isoform X4 [Clupea harengus]
MLIKEYRIPMPLSVEEYRIAQLYMIQKKSREESCGEGSGVEILENRPYTDGPGGEGQYTHKVYHIGQHIPGWFRSILPKAALRVEEESWNAYPYTRTRYTCPFVEKFSIDIETYYKPDTGIKEDVFNLSSSDKRERTVDPIDIVKDPIAPHEYLAEEDPRLYTSEKTLRGPLMDDWIQQIEDNPGKSPVMCAYKLCKVEFRYWGMQSKIERFIHDVGLRKVMVRAHRQAWCWQDEWYGLTIEDIRQLELETQLALAAKMAQYSCNEEGGEAKGTDPAPDQQPEDKQPISTTEAEESGRSSGDTLQARGELTKQWSTSSRSSRSSKRGAGSPSSHSLSEWRMQSIARDSDDSTDDEFFDAPEDFSDNEEIFDKEITKWNSTDLMDKIETTDTDESHGDLYPEPGGDFVEPPSVERVTETLRPVKHSKHHRHHKHHKCSKRLPEIRVHRPPADGSSQQCLQPSKINVLILVLHGGNILDTGAGDHTSKQGDLNTLTTAFETVMRVHYPTALGRVALRLVPCPPICAEAFSLVSHLSPYSYDEGCLSNSQDHIPLAALPLLATSAPQYQEAVATVITRANQVYSDFIKSAEGASFSGQVCVIGDCVGGILAFDALCSSNVSVCESQCSSRRTSIVSVHDHDLLSPALLVNSGPCGTTLEGSRHLSRSNIDIPRCSGAEEPRKQLPRKRSDSSTYELDTIKQHQAFLSSLHSSVLRNDPGSRRSSSSTMLEGGALGKFDFEVSDFFLFGSPLGLVLALRKTVVPTLDVGHLRPACQQVYNLFHPADPSASRLEPLLEKRFHVLPPFSVPRYQRFPLGDGNSALLVETIQSSPQLFLDGVGGMPLRCSEVVSETSIPVPVLNWHAPPGPVESDIVHSHGGMFLESSHPPSPVVLCAVRPPRRPSEVSICSQASGHADNYSATNMANIAGRWWGTKRIDFALYCPDALTAFPTVALPHLFHASYWESTDVVSLLLRQVMRHESSSILELDGKEVSEFTPSKPREKWLRKRTHVKIRNVTANHRVNDAVFTEDGPQVVTGRFVYGPLDMVTLTGEKVDIHIMTQPPSGDWTYFDTELTNSSGRVSYIIPESKRLGIGVYPVKMVVRGDHTSADSYLTVLPRGTEFVVFSIDGSFAASVSIMGSDPKVRAGAVDVVRHWQDLGYMIVYVTGRPDMQKQRVVAWLSQHNFPHGIVSFCDGLVHDPLRHKGNFLKSLICEAHMKIFAAYGSTKDVSVYASIGLPPSHIYIVGRPTKKMQHQCQFIAEGYAAHLSQLEFSQRSRPAKTNSARMVLRKGSFGLGGSGDFLRKRNHLLRTISSQPNAPTPLPTGRPERAFSQSDGERERTDRGQRSMSVAAGCWKRTGSTKLDSALLSPK